jgi:3-methylcrotonyl-CoA carboxylase alpha subunit
VGKLDHFDLPAPGPENVALNGEPRIETGVEEGDAISAFYDPMIAKIVAWGEIRDWAIDELRGYLDQTEVWPVRTNAGFLFNAVMHPDFEAANIDTSFIERHLDQLLPNPAADESIDRAAAAIVILAAEEQAPLPALAGFRLNAPPRLAVALQGKSVELGDDDEIAEVSGFADDERVVVFAEGQAYEFALGSRGTGTTHGLHDGEIEAPMPGKVTAVDVAQGEKVAKGQRLLTLEAMKMEHALTAPFDGTVAELNAKAGAQVSEGQLLAKIEPEAAAGS